LKNHCTNLQAFFQYAQKDEGAVMRKLKRMILIHWHNYTKEIIDFDMINFLTGKTAAGKSTIIDALQLVLLGDTSGNFFNKAANMKSSRTLKGYLFGEKGDDGDTGFHYLRTDRFTSYVALEFEDTERKKPFVVGIICDCYKDQSFDHRFFVIHNQGFPDNHFIDEKTKIPYDISGLRSFLLHWLGNKSAYDIPETNKRYQEISAGKFGQIKQKYRMLLKKAVPFTPISNIEQFITESICDVKNTIDIEQMQSDIRQYKRLEHDAGILKEKIDSLQEIEKISGQYERALGLKRQQEYIVVRSDLEISREKEKQYRKIIEEKTIKIAANQSEIVTLTGEINQLEDRKHKLEEEYRSSDIVKKEQELKNEMEACQNRIIEIETRISEALARLQGFGDRWMSALGRLKMLPAWDIHTEEMEDMLSTLRSLTLETGRDTDFTAIAGQFQRLHSEIKRMEVRLEQSAVSNKAEMEDLKKTIEDLEKGIKPYPPVVSRLQGILQEALKKKYGKNILVSILADLLEVKNPKWRNAIEAYLDTQKFYLITDPAYFGEALRIYNRVKKEEGIHDIGLVDIGKLQADAKITVMKNSLAEEIETEDKNGRTYADFLLGKVIKCEHVDELRKFRTSITADCMLYKGYVARHLNPARYRNPYIGRRSLALLLENMKEDLKENEKRYLDILNQYRIISQAAGQEVLTEYEVNEKRKTFSLEEEWKEKREVYEQRKKEYEELDLTFLDKMKEKLDDLEKVLKEKSRYNLNLNNEIVKLQTQIEDMRQNQLLTANQEIIDLGNKIQLQFEEKWTNEIGEPRFLEVKNAQRTLENIRNSFFSSMRKTEEAIQKLQEERTRKRANYNQIYKMSFDINLKSNEHFEKELTELSEIKLPGYIEKIVDAKEKAYNQFRDDFIAKIKSNIETISLQIKDLNDSLKQSVFGTDTYRFEKKPKPEYKEYYDMIMDPLLMDTGGYNIASESFNQKYSQQISDLFQKLIYNETEVSAERKAEYEKAIRKFTDYKTYLSFDLIVKDDKGEEQRLSKTLLKKSGGETQIPFYIAMLASFSQVCRIRTKNHNTIRVIILDEAFSKMDGERIKESIRLLRRFDLQAIFSAPTDKIPDIAPLVDRNIAVFKGSDHSFTRYFDPKQIEEEFSEDINEV